MMPGMTSVGRLARGASLAFACALAACGGPTFIVQQYSGPVRDPDSIAVLRVNGDGNVVLISLDGEPVRTRVAEDARLHVEMLPGPHSLAIADLADSARPLGRARFVAEPGRVYRPVFASVGPGGARVMEVDASSDAPLRDVTVSAPEPDEPAPSRPLPPPRPRSEGEDVL